MASLSSLIVDRRAGFGSVDGGFETVDLLIGGWIGGLIIGSSDGGSGDDFFFKWACSSGFQICWVTNRRHGFLIGGLGLLIGGLGGGCGGRCWL